MHRPLLLADLQGRRASPAKQILLKVPAPLFDRIEQMADDYRCMRSAVVIALLNEGFRRVRRAAARVRRTAPAERATKAAAQSVAVVALFVRPAFRRQGADVGKEV
jgi:hypothetical protein